MNRNINETLINARAISDRGDALTKSIHNPKYILPWCEQNIA